MSTVYNWQSDAVKGYTGALGASAGTSVFGKNTNNGNAMQPDAFYSDVFLERKRFRAEDLVYAFHAESREIKKGMDTINLRRYQPLKAHIVPLVEGLPPVGDRAKGKAIIAKTRSYGRFMEFTDLFEYKVADPVINEYTMELADLANETIDLLAQAALLAEAQTFFPSKSGATDKASLSTASDTIPTFDDLRVIKLTMEVAKVKSIGGTYQVLASPAVFFDLQTDQTVTNFMQYGQTNSAMATDSIPSVFGLTIRKAQTAKVELFGTKQIHHTIVLGAKAFTKVEIAGGGNVEWFHKGLGSAGTVDPLSQRRTMGWKILSLGFKVTDPDAVIDYMSIPSQAEMITDNFDYVSDVAGDIGISEAMAKQVVEIEGNDKALTMNIAESITHADNADDILELEKTKELPQFADIKAKKVSPANDKSAKVVEVASEK